tara:strand:+ start:825 stop:1001 length:177 start_codon:yes stop_codon:yes gene_type:complete
MTYKLVDTVRGAVLQEFNDKKAAEKAMTYCSLLDNPVVEIQAEEEATPEVKADGKATE